MSENDPRFFEFVSKAPQWIREEFQNRSFVQRLVVPRSRRAVHLCAMLWRDEVSNPDPAALLSGGIELKAEILGPAVDRAAAGSRLIVRGSPEHRMIRAVARRLHESMIADLGWRDVEPIAELADEQARATDENVFVAIEDGKAVGLAIARLYQGVVLSCQAAEEGFLKPKCRFIPLAEGTSVRAVEGVWVAKEYRRRGIAGDLIRALGEGFGTDPRDLVYRLPLTRGAFGLIHRLAEGEFGGVGDLARVHTTNEETAEVIPCDVLPHERDLSRLGV
ncbi:GNAT family N-acetyltransferase [Singulisphaera rosea]